VFAHASPASHRPPHVYYVSIGSAREGIQGIDLDWLSQIRTVAESELFFGFLKEANRVWREQAGLQISLPLHPHQVLPEFAYDWIDRVHVMTYDCPAQHRHAIVQQQYPHRMVESQERNFVLRTTHARNAVQKLLESNCPPHKIWLGIPLYGSRLENEEFPMAMPSPRPLARDREDIQTFSQAVDRYRHHQQQHHHQQQQQSEEEEEEIDLWKGVQSEFEGYQWDDANVIRDKLSQVHGRGLGGVFIWELGQDAPAVNGTHTSGGGGVVLTSLVRAAHRRESWPELEFDSEL